MKNLNGLLLYRFTAGNLALNKPSSQISTGENQLVGLANDGRIDTESCTGQANEHAWFSVNLGGRYDVGRVIVTNAHVGNYFLVILASLVN